MGALWTIPGTERIIQINLHGSIIITLISRNCFNFRCHVLMHGKLCQKYFIIYNDKRLACVYIIYWKNASWALKLYFSVLRLPTPNHLHFDPHLQIFSVHDLEHSYVIYISYVILHDRKHWSSEKDKYAISWSAELQRFRKLNVWLFCVGIL